MKNYRYEYKLFEFTNYANLMLKLIEETRDVVNTNSNKILEYIQTGIQKIIHYITTAKRMRIRNLPLDRTYENHKMTTIRFIEYINNEATNRNISYIFKGDINSRYDVDLFCDEIYRYYMVGMV